MGLKTVSMLIVEDDPDYIFLLKDLLTGEGATGIRYRKEYADTLAKAVEALAQRSFDVILLDLGLPDSQGLETVRRFLPAAPGIPVVVLTCLNDEVVGIQSIREGAQDCLIKGEISFPVISRAINYAIERQRLLLQLEKSREEIKILRGILPICSYCKKIRDDKGYWKQMEMYIRDHSEAEFSHGLCPECAKKAYEEVEELINKGEERKNPAYPVAEQN